MLAEVLRVSCLKKQQKFFVLHSFFRLNRNPVEPTLVNRELAVMLDYVNKWAELSVQVKQNGQLYLPGVTVTSLLLPERTCGS